MPWDDDRLIREELFSIERLEQHAESLAAAQQITARPARAVSLSARLKDDGSVLLDAYRAIAAAVAEGRAITPAAEWLLDNFHVVEDQIREIRDDLPPGYYRQLPKLASGPLAGYPRVFGIAWAYVAHTDSRLEPELLSRFVRAYQRVQPLTIGELWAVAITLRVVLVENLRRGAHLIRGSSTGRQEADAVADRLLGVNGRETEPDALVFPRYEPSSRSRAFVVQLVQRLRDQDPKVTPALAMLESRLAAQGTTADEIVQDELHRQGAANVTVRNIITSMRLISDVDWVAVFENVSLVDELLRSGSEFSSMDLATRNLYRTAVEELARSSPRTELEVVQAALRAADAPQPPMSGPAGCLPERERDPGYHLIGSGRPALERAVGYRATIWSWANRVHRAIGVGAYIGSVAAVTALVLCLALLALAAAGIHDRWLGFFMPLGLIPAIDTAIALVNHVATRFWPATPLPGLALREGVPQQFRTLVAVPTVISTQAALEEQIERLEVHHLANPEGELYFALLSDWRDAATEHMPDDAMLLAAAQAGIARLNRRHAAGAAGERFVLLHRRRIWNAVQGCWMGWERKRGKLHELNRLLRGALDTSFLDVRGRPPAVPADVRYVITLDADTRLPREAARRLVGKLAHPLHRPRFDAAARRVVEGYAVLQPRVTPTLALGREGSTFQRLFSNGGGIDPYAAAVSDVYQDLFDQGSYAGKGIYDVDAFEAALAGRVPENTLLSHDLFEGIFARAGLASDVEVVEEFPSRYGAAAARQHRWARGDWQLLPWILGRGYSAEPDAGPQRIPLIGRWKMLDNLRRTTSAPALVVAFLAGWSLPRAAAAIWTGFLVATIAVPTLLPVVAAILPRRANLATRNHLVSLGADLWLAIGQTAVVLALLAHQGWLMVDAIARTLYRLYVSRRDLLEWVPAAQAKAEASLDVLGIHRQMLGGVAIGLGAGLFIGWIGTAAAPVAAPIALAWLASPLIARWISRTPPAAGRLPVSDEDARSLRWTARRTWRFFETFVTAEDQMLPPDNFQEDPKPVVAHRTSPTNIGLYLLSAISAHDFGWAGRAETLDRLEATLAALSRLERFRGHFYNWYDTRDLRPLDPRYISSVDSGNLAGHLIAVANACREWSAVPCARRDALRGIEDALQLLREALQDGAREPQAASAARRALDASLHSLAAALRDSDDAGETEARTASAAEQVAAAAELARARAGELGADAGADVRYWADALQRRIESLERDARQDPGRERERLAALELQARSVAGAMEFGFLLSADRQLLSIGYLVPEGKLDSSCYDLLASEARLASFVAIAKGDVPARHWFRLGRAVTPLENGAALISWSGSMFEYLMPSLVMRAPAGSLLEQTSRLITRRQIAYGASLGVPWGVSESAYHVRDRELTYQYSNFGVPGLGLKRGLGENVVVAPYATALAAMVDPAASARNLARLAALGARGRYGFYEALDYTRSRLPEGVDVAIVRAFMAHHQGMTVVAIANALLDGRMRARFHSEPIVQATELLLQERTPRDVAVAHPRAEEVGTAARVREPELRSARQLRSGHGNKPEVHLLANDRYAVMITGAGSGYSRWRDLAVTRWREDVTRDDWGSYFFVRDVESERIWSAGYQPSGVEPDGYEVSFTEDRARFVRSDRGITTALDVLVSPEDDAEVRRVALTNTGESVRVLEVTSYAELVLAPAAADTAHPAFSKLFVQTEYVPECAAILATRRRRSPDEPEVWAAHHAVVEGAPGSAIGPIEIETDRARFLGRGRELRSALAVRGGLPLSNRVGVVLDPIFALRRRVRIEPGATVCIAFWTTAAASRAEVLDLVDKHLDASAFERAATLAWTQGQVLLRHLNVDPVEASLFQRLASDVLYANPALRPPSDVLRRGAGGPSGLWAHSISGDRPIVLVRIAGMEDIALVRQLLRAHEYWRMKRLAVDIVILNERGSSYMQDLQIAVETAVRSSQSASAGSGDSAGGSVFALRADLLSEPTRALLPAVARVVLVGRRGMLSDQLSAARISIHPPARRVRRARRPAAAAAPAASVTPLAELEFFNGLGGFAEHGKEYVIVLRPGESTPAPWLNVIANPSFGFQVAAEGGGYTWSANSRENQLTPWSNDPVSDRPGEVLYVRDEDSGALWGPTASPIRDSAAPYVARHGAGYSRFEHHAEGIALALVQYVPIDAPIKISRLVLRNTSDRPRRLSVTSYTEWLLGGPARSAASPFVVTEIDPETGALFARNPWNAAFGSRVAFADLGGRQTDWTADRREFLGQNGTLDAPAALALVAPLSRRVGAGLDPCAVLQTRIELEPGEQAEVVCLLGQAETQAEARSLIVQYRSADLDAVLRSVAEHWDAVLGAVQVKTPDRAMDLLLNRWLLYQTLACRMWARSAFYQASGAYGFRDQLQDSLALSASRPALAREQLLRAAARQFIEGDVQHWWLPHSGQGVRTRISDDRIWLAYATAHYVETTGDLEVLDERVPYLEGQALRSGELDAYFQPMVSDEVGTLFEHCARALDQSLAVGAHGLPLIGSGDWNDGMNRVGAAGKGESVWLGWFLYTALVSFAARAKARGEPGGGEHWLAHAAALQTALEREGWDGEWYRRGYFDDGTPLGSASSDECRIDSIAQSWSVLSGAADPDRAERSMAAVQQQLISADTGLALLFTPPFDRTELDPGYVKGYPPGIRENGGQYTHAATWSVIAFARLGLGDRAAELFSLLNPIHHSSTPERAQRYQVEPYVVAADVYSVAPHVGRGGWTWYTGSAGWLYRAGLESILGFQLQGRSLLLAPCIPRSWAGFELEFCHRSARYAIAVENPRGDSSGVVHAELDGKSIADRPVRIPLQDDGETHRVKLILGAS